MSEFERCMDDPHAYILMYVLVYKKHLFHTLPWCGMYTLCLILGFTPQTN